MKSLLALILIVPVTSLGVFLSMLIIPGIFGQIAAFVCSISLLLIPVIWTRIDENINLLSSINLKTFRTKGYGVGAISGLVMSFVILIGYWSLGKNYLDLGSVKMQVQQLGLNPYILIFGIGIYQIFIQSVIEEFVWRYFVIKHVMNVIPKVNSKVLYNYLASAICSLFFSIHHAILIFIYTNNIVLTLLGTFAIFLVGLFWSMLTIRYKSIIPAMVSHAIIDFTLVVISGLILFC
jgi:uncharacterized protein